MWYVYILLCDNKTYYVGISCDIDRRLKEHREGQSKFTKQFTDIKLLYKEKSNSKFQAAQREKQIKGWSRNKKQELINNL